MSGDPGRHHLVIATHHAMADGRSAWRILADLLATCSALVRGAPLPAFLPPGAPLDEVLPPVPRRALLTHRLRRLRRRLALGRGRAPETVPGTRRSRILCRTLPARLVGALREKARRADLTFTGLLAAALIDAVADGLVLRKHLRVSHSVSLRALAMPPVPAVQVGCFATSVDTWHALHPLAPPMRAAAQVSRTIRGRLASREILAGIVASRGQFANLLRGAMEAAARGDMGTLALSNRGAFQLGDVAPFALRSWHGATGNHLLGHGCHVSCSTVDGQLSIGLVHVEPVITHEAASTVLARFAEGLVRMAGETS